MPLISCPACSQEISDRTINCPECGLLVKHIIPKPVLATVKCLDCKSEFNLSAEVCPKCGQFNLQKYGQVNSESSDSSEDGTFICIACPKC